MPKITFQPSQSMLPTRIYGGKVSPYETGMPQVGEGLALLGKTLDDFQQQKEVAEANRQLSNAETELATTWGGIKDKWENGIKNWDENLPKIAQEDLDTLKKVGLSITNEKARLAFQDTLAKVHASAQVEINGYQNKLQINQGIADSSKRIDTFKQLRPKTNNPAEKKWIDQLVITHINRDKESGFLTPQKAQEEIEKYQQFARNDDVTSALEEMTAKYGAEATLEFLNNPENRRKLIEQSSPEAINSYHAILAANVSWEDHKKTKAKEQLTEAQDANIRSQIVKFWSGKFNPNETLAMIANKQIDETRGAALLGAFQSRVEKEKTEKTAEDKKKLEEASYLNYAQLLPKVRKVVEAGREQDIDAMADTINDRFMKDQLSDSHAKQLTEILYPSDKEKAKDPTKDPRITDKLGTLEKLHTAGIFGKKNTPEAAITYSKKHDDLIDWAKAHPDATSQQIEDKFSSLVKVEKKGFWAGVLDSWKGNKKQAAPVEAPPKQQMPLASSYEVNKVYTNAQGRRAKYLGQKEGKDQWQMVE